MSSTILTNLLNGHYDLHGVEAVKTEVIVKMRFGVQLHHVRSVLTLSLEVQSRIYLGHILNL